MLDKDNTKMGEAETCGGCSKWEEKIYWTHFQKMHFFLSLVGDFTVEVAIPKKFSNHLKNKLPEAATLKGPSGVIWDVGMATSGDNLFFKKGWKEFVINHSLEENDLLIFQYHGDSHFDVLMFDGHSSCEKETSYFVRKCGHKKPDVEYQTTEKARDSSVEDISAPSDDGAVCGHKKPDIGSQTKEKAKDSSVKDIPTAADDGVGCGHKRPDGGCQTKKTRKSSVKVVHAELDDNIGSPLPKKPRKDEVVMPMPSIRRNRNVPKASKRTRKVTRSIKPATPKGKIGKIESSTSAVGGKVISGSDAEQNSIIGIGGYNLQYVSGRRTITEAEKEKALQLAHAAFSSESFVVVMRPTHVYRRFYLTIPSEWATKHLSFENQDVTLLYKENEWCARLQRNMHGGFGALTGGWKEFSVENNLEEHDVCRFELTSPAGSSAVLNVSIFRVVEELTPLTLVTSASSPRQKPSRNGRRKSL